MFCLNVINTDTAKGEQWRVILILITSLVGPWCLDGYCSSGLVTQYSLVELLLQQSSWIIWILNDCQLVVIGYMIGKLSMPPLDYFLELTFSNIFSYNCTDLGYRMQPWWFILKMVLFKIKQGFPPKFLMIYF